MKRQKLIKSEVIKLFNTTKETLRHYEKIGLISPEVDDKNYRYYDVSELNILRQIFVLKELGFSTSEMKVMLNHTIDRKDYLSKMVEHTQLLEEKIQQLQEIKEHSKQLIDLLQEESFSLSFKLKKKEKRQFIVINPFESELMNDIKSYYDTFDQLIDSDLYSERVLMYIFDFSTLGDFKKENSRIGIEINSSNSKALSTKEYDLLTLKSGLYLSVYYIFKGWHLNHLKSLKEDIEAYCKDHGLIIESETVVEIEHPELGVVFDEHEGLYEVQLKVRRS